MNNNIIKGRNSKNNLLKFIFIEHINQIQKIKNSNIILQAIMLLILLKKLIKIVLIQKKTKLYIFQVGV